MRYFFEPDRLRAGKIRALVTLLSRQPIYLAFHKIIPAGHIDLAADLA